MSVASTSAPVRSKGSRWECLLLLASHCVDAGKLELRSHSSYIINIAGVAYLNLTFSFSVDLVLVPSEFWLTFSANTG